MTTGAQAGFKQSLSRPMHYLGLLTCLLFGSLYLPAQAAEANKASAAEVKLSARKSPGAHFQDGNTCLMQANIACAKLALANIPSLSPYAKLLSGGIALREQRVDDAMQLLLPLQSEKDISVEAKISLHQYLATVFESIDDTPQAIGHLMQAKSIATTSALPDIQAKIDAVHQKVWALLNKQGQSQLLAMRGDNTDNDFQGWIDLCLAAKNQDVATSITNWQTNYPDHSAIAFAKTLTQSVSHTQAKFSLPSGGSIAVILPLADEANAAKADAFKQGLQAALTKHEILNDIKIYASSGSPESITDQYTLAKAEGASYFILPDFNHIPDAIASVIDQDINPILNVGLLLNDETQRIVDFANGHAIQHIVIVTTDNPAARQMSSSFRAAWQAKLNVTEQNDQVHVITLADGFMPGGTALLDLKAQISAFNHDMVLLAMSATEARIVRPYLNISTPTLAFSNVHDSTGLDTSLNAVRFVDIPFLLPTDNDPFPGYRKVSSNLDSNELLRWFALGVDAPYLLVAKQQAADSEKIINGLTGTLTIDKAGNIQRQLSVARFTFNGTELENDH